MLYMPTVPAVRLAEEPILVTPAVAPRGPAELPREVAFVAMALAPTPTAVEKFPVAVVADPQAMSVGLLAATSAPDCGSPPFALPPHTNCACATMGTSDIAATKK